MRVSLPIWAAGLAISSAPTVSAFYPYIPKYGDDESNSKVRREPHSTLPLTGDAASITLPLRRVSVRRDNVYRIIESDDPKQENSVAIDQDANEQWVGNDLSYMVAVKFGDSKEEYHMLLDSAASNTWVMGQSCQTDACGTHTLFGKADSSSLEISSETFEIVYGTGTVSGVVASDTLHIGPLSPSLSFGLATNVSDEFRAFPMDGILGIGRGTTVEGRVDSPGVLEVLKTSNLINSRLYGIHLFRGKEGLKDGEMNFGAPNTDRYDGDLTNVPVVDNDNGFWELKVDDVGVDGVELGLGERTAIVDTGTAFIFMPEADATSIHDLIPGYTKSGETFSVPCDTKKVIWIEFGGQKFNISVADWVGGKLDSGLCKSNIIGRQTFGEHQWLVGDVFLKNVYTVFDFENSQVGFGVKGEKDKEKSTTTSSGTSTATSTSTSAASSSVDPSATGLQTSQETPSPKALDTTGANKSPSSTGGAAQASLSSLSLVSTFILGAFVWCM